MKLHLFRRPLLALMVMGSSAMAQTSPLGLWETIDDESGQAQSLVRLHEKGGIIEGAIERILDPAKANKRCEDCPGDRKDKPLVGLTVIQKLQALAQEPLTWSGGEILDPKTGRTYRVRLRLLEAGKTLEVRGYIGAPAFGRTQLWRRAASHDSGQ